MPRVLPKAGGYFIEPRLPRVKRDRYILGSGLFLTSLWSGFVILLLVGAPFSFVLYAAIALFSLFVLIRAPEAGVIALVVTTMFFETSFTLQPIVIGESVYKFYLVDTLLTLTLLAFFIGGRFRRWRFDRLDRLVIWFDILLGVYFIASFFLKGVDTSISFSTFKTYVFYSLLYFMTRRMVSARGGLDLLRAMFYIGGLGILVFIGIGILSGQGLWVSATPLSTAGSRLLAPSQAFYLLFPFLLALSGAPFPGELLNTLEARILLVWLWGLGIVFSLARHLWIVLIVQVALLGHFISTVRHSLRRYFEIPLIAGVLLVVLVLALGLAVPDVTRDVTPTGGGGLHSLMLRVASVFSSGDVSVDWRLAIWRQGLTEFTRHPVLGIGLGRDIVFRSGGVTQTVPVREMHNSLFALLLQTGLVGFGLFTWLLWEAARRVRFANREHIVAAVAVIGVLIAALFGTYFEANFLIIFFWVALGWLAAL